MMTAEFSSNHERWGHGVMLAQKEKIGKKETSTKIQRGKMNEQKSVRLTERESKINYNSRKKRETIGQKNTTFLYK